MARDRGFHLVELLVALAVALLVIAGLAPPLLRASAAGRVRAAAGELSGVLRQARAHAVLTSSRVGVKFRAEGERVSWTLYRDGDGDGVRTRDIEAGTDPAVAAPRLLAHLGGAVRFGFPPGPPPRDPGSPSRRLRRREDPIRFNRSDIASFGPLGGATPGSLYLTDSRHHLMVVRVFGRSGKVRVLRWDAAADRWR